MFSVFFLIFGSIGETPFSLFMVLVNDYFTPEWNKEVRDISRQVVAALFRPMTGLFEAVYVMGRGRKGVLDQSVKKKNIKKKIM